MIVSTEILENLFMDFSEFVASVDKKPFTTFKISQLVNKTENYKYSVYDEARVNLGNKLWKLEDIGTGKIQEAVSSAIKTRVHHSFEIVNNNLVDWRKKDDFSKRAKSKSLETILFNFYKSKTKDSEAFEQLVDEKLSYQFIAYLFFIKDSQKFLPISQKRFDKIFEQIGLPDFKTSNKGSWDNYSTFNDIIKQVRNFLQTKDIKTTLLDAHSFLWILGNQMKQTNSTAPIVLKSETSTSNTYLFVWNPDKWNWTTLEQAIEQLENSGKTTERWSCRSHKSIKPGDRAFLARVGSQSQGIFAAGYVSSKPFLSKHWSGEDKNIFRVLIDFEVLLNPDKEPILTLDILNKGNLEKQKWTPQSSGISIKPELVDELEAVWFDFLTTQKVRLNPYAPADSEEKTTYTEGTPNQVTQTQYERNPFAREACIKHFGYSCAVCQFDFEIHYGEIGKNFIHVHHLTKVATVGKPYEVNPVKDLIPVCPNCHAMLHRQNPPLTIEVLKSLLK